MTLQILVLEVLNCLLQCDYVPFLRSVLLSMVPFPRRGPGFQMWMLSLLLLGRAIGHVAVKMILWALQRVFSAWCIAERWISTLRTDIVTPKSDLGVRLHPCRRTLPRMGEIADTGSRCSMVPKMLRFPQSLSVSMMVRLILKMLARMTSARISSRVVFHSSPLAVCNFADSLALEIRRGLSSPCA